MKLLEQQKNLLKASVPGLLALIGAPVINSLIGRQSWADALWASLIGVGVWAVIVGFLLLGSRVPKKKEENQ